MVEPASGFDTQTLRLFNAAAAVFWLAAGVVALITQRAGGRRWRFSRSGAPKTYWVIVGACFAIAAWTGVAAFLQKGVVDDCRNAPHAWRPFDPLPISVCDAPSMPTPAQRKTPAS
jgi:hypothetical protein